MLRRVKSFLGNLESWNSFQPKIEEVGRKTWGHLTPLPNLDRVKTSSISSSLNLFHKAISSVSARLRPTQGYLKWHALDSLKQKVKSGGFWSRIVKFPENRANMKREMFSSGNLENVSDYVKVHSSSYLAFLSVDAKHLYFLLIVSCV